MERVFDCTVLRVFRLEVGCMPVSGQLVPRKKKKTITNQEQLGFQGSTEGTANNDLWVR